MLFASQRCEFLFITCIIVKIILNLGCANKIWVQD